MVLCGICNFLNAQSPYELNWKKELTYSALGLTTNIIGFSLDAKVVPFTELEISKFNRSSVNAFDRMATFKYSASARRASDFLQYSCYTFPTLFLLNKKSRKNFGHIMALYGETLLVTGGITNLTKKITKRPRPFVYNELVPLEDKQTKGAQYSFFSGHTSVIATSSFFTAKVWSDHFPDSKWKPLVWGSAVALPTLMGYLRVKGGKHYPTDVITGLAVGGAIGFLIPHLHKKERKGLNILPTNSGVILFLKF